MSAPTSPLTARVVFELIPPLESGAPSVPVDVELVYDARDPYAVSAVFQAGVKGSTVWVFARELLHAGLVGPAGVGDVHVRPAAEDVHRVLIELSSPTGRAVFTADADEIGAFLEASCELVPRGAEALWLDVDAGLAALLNRDDRGVK